MGHGFFLRFGAWQMLVAQQTLHRDFKISADFAALYAEFQRTDPMGMGSMRMFVLRKSKWGSHAKKSQTGCRQKTFHIHLF
jgi:hypothetical protein